MSSFLEFTTSLDFSSSEARTLIVLSALLLVVYLAIACVWSHNHATFSAIYLNPSEFEFEVDSAVPQSSRDREQSDFASSPLNQSGPLNSVFTPWQAAQGKDEPARVRVRPRATPGPADGSIPRYSSPPRSPASNHRVDSVSSTCASPPRMPAFSRLASQLAFSQASAPPASNARGVTSTRPSMVSTGPTSAIYSSGGVPRAPLSPSPLRSAQAGGSSGALQAPEPDQNGASGCIARSLITEVGAEEALLLR